MNTTVKLDNEYEANIYKSKSCLGTYNYNLLKNGKIVSGMRLFRTVEEASYHALKKYRSIIGERYVRSN